MKPEVQEILDLVPVSPLAAEEKCIALIERAKTNFLEQLTVNVATDFIGVVLLFANLCGAQKKPWKAAPFLDECFGAVRFLEDFIQDRSVLGETCLAIASAYEYANFYPEAKKYYWRAIKNDPSASNLEDSLYSYLLMSFFAHGKLDQNSKKEIAKTIDSARIDSLAEEAKSAYESSVKTDPIERDEAYLAVRFDVEKKVDEILSSEEESNVPFCLRYWNTKREVLKKDFAIDWKTPAELNPDVSFC